MAHFKYFIFVCVDMKNGSENLTSAVSTVLHVLVYLLTSFPIKDNHSYSENNEDISFYYSAHIHMFYEYCQH